MRDANCVPFSLNPCGGVRVCLPHLKNDSDNLYTCNLYNLQLTSAWIKSWKTRGEHFIYSSFHYLTQWKKKYFQLLGDFFQPPYTELVTIYEVSCPCIIICLIQNFEAVSASKLVLYAVIMAQFLGDYLASIYRVGESV